MLQALVKSFNYCIENNTGIIEIRKLNLKNAEYARMNDLVRFGLAFKEDSMKQGMYGIPRGRVSDFLRGKRRVAAYYWTDPTKGKRQHNEMSEERISIDEVPSIQRLRQELGPTLTAYEFNDGLL